MPSPWRQATCELCGAVWATRSPRARTCSPSCRAVLREREKPSAGHPLREYPLEVTLLAVQLYEAGLTVAEIRGVFPAGYRVQTILERHLPSRRPAIKRDQNGPANHSWKASPSYGAAHLRLRAAHGPAREQACVDCPKPAADWSYNGSAPDECTDPVTGCRYTTDLSYYSPRCRSCHRTHDAAERAAQEVMSHV